MEQNQKSFAPGAATDEPAPSPQQADPGAFDPVPVRARRDGWTPEKQREFIEALADTGLVREAAARVGMTEQSASRLRRRADARAFAIAWEAAIRPGARRLHAIAWERAIEGTIKRHYYHGELKSEERVYDNRLLVYLLGKTEHLLDEPAESRAVAQNWQPWMEALKQGAPPPDLAPRYEDEAAEGEEDDLALALTGDEVWQDEGVWWTRFPPPACFEGWEEEVFGQENYMRTLSPAEQAVAEAEADEEEESKLARAIALRDLNFGFEGGRPEHGDYDSEDEADGAEAGDDEEGGGGKSDGGNGIFSPMKAEPLDLSPDLSCSTSPATGSMEPSHE